MRRIWKTRRKPSRVCKRGVQVATASIRRRRSRKDPGEPSPVRGRVIPAPYWMASVSSFRDEQHHRVRLDAVARAEWDHRTVVALDDVRSEEHTSELQSRF